MRQEIIDVDARKYKTVICPCCGKNDRIELEKVYKDDNNDDIYKYICEYCNITFDLKKEDRDYKKDSNKNEWKDVTEEMKYIMGIKM
ncbi:hypothetical protein PN290_09565 [Romboutsia sp. 1001216sp1]|uniref:hypothetical protein n=1 Tax=Romboutsia TaxID=1501226 RepID=UPI000B853EB7|nr:MULTISPECIES: hypothetical protein [Romboutsia]MDB8793340.1 hypothetical protein [Romboutsia sp. 1001216sp1]MDB8796767.1 hypothetical protein [Romboutsia sp. 1001216sp1]MDB8799628.1 hypothetical protein [Romboutsia sp. 1001216sp1]